MCVAVVKCEPIDMYTQSDEIVSHTVADLWGGAVHQARGPPHEPNFSQFHAVFFGNFGKIVCWYPLLPGILNPPLSLCEHLSLNTFTENNVTYYLRQSHRVNETTS